MSFALTADLVREGFPDLSPGDFIALFCRANRCGPATRVTRIEFRYVEAADLPVRRTACAGPAPTDRAP